MDFLYQILAAVITAVILTGLAIGILVVIAQIGVSP